MISPEPPKITPNASIGWFKLDATESQIRRFAGEPDHERKREGIRFLFYDQLTVGLFKGQDTMLIAESPLAGETPKGIKVGTSWDALTRQLGPMEYDEENGLWYSHHERGLWFEVVRPSRPDESPIDPPFVPEQYEVNDPDQATVRRIYVM